MVFKKENLLSRNETSDLGKYKEKGVSVNTDGQLVTKEESLTRRRRLR